MKQRTIRFPPHSSIGTLSVRLAGSREEWTDFAKAIGDVVIPFGKEVRLEIDSPDFFEPEIFSTFEPDTLTVLEWVGTRKTDNAAIEHIQHLTALKGLALWETAIEDESLLRLGHLSNLRWLDIGDTRITDVGLAYLKELSLLGELTLLNDRVTDKGMIHLQQLPKLERLDVMNTLVTDHGAKSLCKMSRLKNLRIFNTGITEKGYRELKSALPACNISYFHPHHAENP